MTAQPGIMQDTPKDDAPELRHAITSFEKARHLDHRIYRVGSRSWTWKWSRPAT